MISRIKGTTKLIGLLGDPVKHSLSPLMHNTAFKALNLDYVYMAFQVKEGFIKEGIEAVKTFNLEGFNLTMPHKQRVMEYLDEVSEEAALIGSVNTVKNIDGKLFGYNTDGKGFVKSLEEKNIEYKGKKIVLTGAGGAARAVAIQLAYDGAGEITIFNRTMDSAVEIVDIINKNIPSCKGKAFKLKEEELMKEIRDASIFVNCTSVGMEPNAGESIISSNKAFHKDLFVADIIYEPKKTKLLSMAEEAGCKYMNGLMMLIWQGAIAFNIWTGKNMPVDLIKKLLEKQGFYV
ncbi:MAG TPA: shikimate dehydrogenase [Tissierellia bacterium]|nr:shikimate dehydrogenase [Tissierellia bacterium]